jgi:hypothetical protein
MRSHLLKSLLHVGGRAMWQPGEDGAARECLGIDG